MSDRPAAAAAQGHSMQQDQPYAQSTQNVPTAGWGRLALQADAAAVIKQHTTPACLAGPVNPTLLLLWFDYTNAAGLPQRGDAAILTSSHAP
jgi:hypothetical protein